MLTADDNLQISKKGIEINTVEKQIEHFKNGFPYVRLNRPATINDGIIRFDNDEILRHQERFANEKSTYKIIKFVPASGAASRMFKHLFEFAAVCRNNEQGTELLQKDQGFNSVYYLISHLQELAAYPSLCEFLSMNGETPESLLQQHEYTRLINSILSEAGLDYANLPKGLLQFHQYPEGARTAAEEHLVEAAHYATDVHSVSRIHFTISPEHEQKFNHLWRKTVPSYESRFGVRYDITMSFQKPSTDTIAVDENNQPFRNEQGTIIFRPGGHGALIDNLNELDADIIFIKNIDNIVPDRLKGMTYLYKSVIGGYLIQLKSIITEYLGKLENEVLTAETLNEIKRFASEKLNLTIPQTLSNMSLSSQQAFLFHLLNRPVRICGMVKNEGEPGGGPFWVLNNSNELSLQIVESSQIDFSDLNQKNIVNSSTHFNPVDLVCAVRDHHGVKYNLKAFIDENTGFISLKSTGGKTLKAQELPGLWNGAMAHWITLFVEVPIITFNPVKTINDLLRDEHKAM
jgi:hypothetical protein